MHLRSPRKLSITVSALCGIVLMNTFAFRAQADQWDKRTILTVNQPIQVTNTVLEPGTYVFKLADSSSDRHIVQIFNGDGSRIVDTILAIPNYRLQPTDKSRFTFWETPPGTARALRAWFYPGDNFGQEFRYPKHLKELAVLRAPAPESSAVSADRSVTETETRTQETPAPPAPAAELKQEPPPAEQPVEIAQNVAPPPAAPAPQPAPPAELPKTASPYPLIGLGGLLSFGLYGLLRLTRRA